MNYSILILMRTGDVVTEGAILPAVNGLTIRDFLLGYGYDFSRILGVKVFDANGKRVY